ncbi:hypothetical protein ACFMPD_16870 [Sedimentitalea sp. HM32M-2]|uniref:hypothetical protein n=1 Tax=Sedimentitalea sp. HM32M-2 TaxID=3351566 RepID=UPI003640BD09
MDFNTKTAISLAGLPGALHVRGRRRKKLAMLAPDPPGSGRGTALCPVYDGKDLSAGQHI